MSARGKQWRAQGGRRSPGAARRKGAAEFRQAINHLLSLRIGRDAEGLAPFRARCRHRNLCHGQHHIRSRPIAQFYRQEFKRLNKTRHFPWLARQAALVGENIGALFD